MTSAEKICCKCGAKMVQSLKRNAFVCPDINCGHSEPLPGTAQGSGEGHAAEKALAAELPAVLSRVLWSQINEQHPILRLYRLCDGIEVLTRFLTLAGWMDLQASLSGHLPKKLIRSFANRISRPTFGMWAGMLSDLAKEGRRRSNLLVPELVPLALDTLLPWLGTSGGSPDAEIIPLRNLIFHGGTGLTHEMARWYLDAHEGKSLEVWKRCAFFSNMTLAYVRRGNLIILRGHTDTPEECATPQGLASPLADHDRHIVLIRGEKILNLWPILDFDRAHMPSARGLRKALTSSPLLYFRIDQGALLYSAFWGDLPQSQRTDIMAEFMVMFHLADLRAQAGESIAEDFYDEISADAGRMIGRQAELKSLKSAVKDCKSGPLWVTGQGGIGKTILMARLALDLRNAPQDHSFAVPYRFKAGDVRCSRAKFMHFAVREVSAWLFRQGALPIEAQAAAGLRDLEKQFKQLLQAVSGLKPVAGRGRDIPPQLIFLLDGLDELIRYDPDFPNLIFRHSGQNILWVCAGRPEGPLPQAFSPERCCHVFPPGGLPEMTVEDVRAMLMEACSGRKYSLLERDEEREGVIHNAFVDAVARHAKGLPLYVRYVIEDINCGEYAFSNESVLPPGLSAYYDELLRRVGISDLQEILTPLIVMICWTEEPLTPSAMQELFTWRGILEPGPTATDLLLRAITYAQSLLRQTPTHGGALGYTMYHDTFRTHVRESPHTRNATARIRKDLARAAITWKDFKVEGDARAYLERKGIFHLLAQDQFAEALEILHHFRSIPGDCPNLKLEEVQLIERALLLDLDRCAGIPGKPQTLDIRHLLDIVLWHGDEIEVFRGAMRTLLQRQESDRGLIIDKIIESENWEPMCAMSLAMAEMCAGTSKNSILTEIMALADSGQMPRHELGLYALKHIASDQTTIDPELLRPFLSGRSFIRRSILGELLIDLALNKVDVIQLILAERLLDSPWPYHRVQFEDAVATQCFVTGSGTSRFDDSPGVVQSFSEIRRTDSLRRSLETSPAISSEASLIGLVRNYYSLPNNLESISEAARSLGRSPELARFARLLFAHSSWEVRATAGFVVGGLCSSREDLWDFLRAAMRDSDWRVRYGVMGAIDVASGFDKGALLEEGLHLMTADPQSWVRGIATECLRSWIVQCDEDVRNSRLRKFSKEITYLLHDKDMWPLEVIQLTLRQLSKAGVDITPFISAAEGGMLARIKGWSEMSREQLYNALDKEHGNNRPLV